MFYHINTSSCKEKNSNIQMPSRHCAKICLNLSDIKQYLKQNIKPFLLSTHIFWHHLGAVNGIFSFLKNLFVLVGGQLLYSIVVVSATPQYGLAVGIPVPLS